VKREGDYRGLEYSVVVGPGREEREAESFTEKIQ